MPVFTVPAARELYTLLTADTTLVPQEPTQDSLAELVLHVAEGCNLGCSYCFADSGQYGRSEAKWMTEEAAKDYAWQAVERYHDIGFIKFFGGEPLMNLPAIEAAIEVFRDAASSGRLARVPEFGCVTNMTIATPRVVKLIRDADFYITGSIDGPEDVHDAFRTYRDGRGSWKLVDRNIRRLQAETGSPRSLEAVFGPKHIRLGYSFIDIHEYLIGDYQPENVIIHVMGREPTVDHLDGWEEFDQSVRSLLFDYGKYLVKNLDEPTCRVIVSDALKSMRKETRVDAHCTLGVQTQTITADGELYPCYTLIGRDEWRMEADVTRRATGDDGHERVQLRLLDNTKSGNPHCATCEMMTTCQSCPGMWQHITGGIDIPEPSQCSAHAGLTEGVLVGLIQAREEPAKWTQIQRLLSA